MKECKTCKIKKPYDQFSKDRENLDGRFGECKACYKIRANRRKEDIKKRKEFEIV